MAWYFLRLYVHVRPERVYVWPHGDLEGEPQLFDSHMEEVRSSHNAGARGARRRRRAREGRSGTSGSTRSAQATSGRACWRSPAPTASRSRCASAVQPDRGERLIRLSGDPVGAPLDPGKACLVIHGHPPDFSWQWNFQVRGDLVLEDSGWALAPRKIVGGFEIPPGGPVAQIKANAKKVRRYHKVAKAEMARRGGA